MHGCYRSHSAWGPRTRPLLRDLGADVAGVWNRACHGATIANFTHRYLLQPNSFATAAGSSLDVDHVQALCDAETARRHVAGTLADALLVAAGPAVSTGHGSATGWCDLYVRPQLDNVDDTYDDIAFTMGGNDLGFQDIVKACFVPVLRSGGECREATQSARWGLARIPSLLSAATVGAVSSASVRARPPSASVHYIGYPNLEVDRGYEVDGFPAGRWSPPSFGKATRLAPRSSMSSGAGVPAQPSCR